MEGDSVDQVALIDADCGIEVVLFGGSEDSIDQIGLDRWFRGAGNDQELVDIGNDYVPTFLARTAQLGAAVLDTNNPALVGSVGFYIDAIAGDYDMALLGSQIFQDAADCAPEFFAGIKQNDRFESVNSEYCPAKNVGGCLEGNVTEGIAFAWRGGYTSHRASAC